MLEKVESAFVDQPLQFLRVLSVIVTVVVESPAFATTTASFEWLRKSAVMNDRRKKAALVANDTAMTGMGSSVVESAENVQNTVQGSNFGLAFGEHTTRA